MKLTPVLFALSLAANVVLLAAGWVLRPASALSEPTHRRDAPVQNIPNRTRASTENLWPMLDTADLPALIGRLRGAGFSAGLIRAIVTAKVEARFKARLQPLLAAAEDAPFWKPEPTDYFYGDRKFREALNQAYGDRSRQLRELLGDDSFVQAGSNATAFQRRQYGNLSPEKTELIARINEDYNEMVSQIRTAMQGLTLPEDREKLALLEREKRADLAAILSPGKFVDHDLRTSPITSRLRGALTFIDANESEFRSIYAAHAAHRDLLHPAVGLAPNIITKELRTERENAQLEIAAQLKRALGESRYAELARASIPEFQTLHQFAQRENVSREAIVRAFDLREHVAHESNRIFDDPTLSIDQKRAALQFLAQSTTAELTATLGPAVATSYLNSAQSWVSAVERGRAITFGPDGVMQSTRMLPPPRK